MTPDTPLSLDPGAEYHPPELYAPERTAEQWPDLNALDREDAQREFCDLGYLAVQTALTADEVRDAINAIDDLVVGKAEGYQDVQFEAAARDGLDALSADERRDRVRKLMNFVPHDDRLARIAAKPALQSVIRRLMDGREPKLFQDMALLKPPHLGREKPWHQDNAYFDIDPTEPIIGVWIALDEARIDNGCMHLLEGGHKEGPRLHWQRRDWQICDTEMLGLRSVAAPLPPGGALFFDALLPHGTPTNRSPHRRRALQLHYAPADVVPISTDQRLALFGTEGKDVEC